MTPPERAPSHPSTPEVASQELKEAQTQLTQYEERSAKEEEHISTMLQTNALALEMKQSRRVALLKEIEDAVGKLSDEELAKKNEELQALENEIAEQQEQTKEYEKRMAKAKTEYDMDKQRLALGQEIE